MDHGYIQEHQIISLYLMGKLTSADRIEFEEHLIDCRQCLDELELTSDFRETLQRVVAENESRSGWSLATWLLGFGAWRRTTLLTAAALAVAGFAILFFGQRRRVEQELERTRTASAGWELRYRNEQRARELAESELRDSLAQAAAPLFTLNLTRGADLSTAEPTNTVTISPSAKSIVLSLEWQNDPEFQSYRTSLADANERVVWFADSIAPPSSGALAITLPASLFKPGRYLLRAEGTKAGRSSVVGRYSFLVVFSK
jgi:hypothetical protein